MKAKNIILKGLYQSLGLAAYCILIAFIMNNLSKLFTSNPGVTNNLLQGFMFLIIFLVSALITGSIALAYPISLGFRKNIKEAAFIVLSTVLWSILFLIVALVAAIVIYKP
jgi:hypothetical protein